MPRAGGALSPDTMRDRPARRILLAAALASALVAAAVASAANGRQHADRTPAAVPGSIIVGFKSNVSAKGRAGVLSAVGARPTKRFAQIDSTVVSVSPANTSWTIRTLEQDPRVAYAEPNFVLHAADTPNDPSFPQEWGLNNTGQQVNFTTGTPDADIDAKEAWSVSTGSPDVTVAVIDTGVDVTHPDLAQNIWINEGENCTGCRTNGIDDDGDGYVDDWRGWDFVNHDNNPTDDNGHGTHVAGTIAAAGNNGVGVTGVTWNSTIMPLKFLDSSGSGSTEDAISAILYARAKGVPIMNNSWGGGDFSQALEDAIELTDSSGELFVAAAGNDFTNTDAEPFWPSSYDTPNIISVGASDQFDRKAWFSNYGVRTVDLSAPGTNVYSTWKGSTYRFADGTSMAAPHVSGAAALVKAVFPNASGVGLKALLLRTVDPIAALSGASRTAGRLNVDHAVRCTGPQAWIESPANGVELNAGDPVEVRVIGVQCGSPDGVSVTATLNGSPFPLVARGDGLYTATFTPSAGAINLSVTATSGTSTDTQSVSAMADQTYAIVPGGSPVTITTHSAGENAWLTFDAQAGQRIALKMSGVTIGPSPCCSTYVWIYKPDGTSARLADARRHERRLRRHARAAHDRPLQDPRRPAGDVDRLDDADAVRRPAGRRDDDHHPGGAPVTVTTGPTPGQNALVRFDGVAGRRVSLLPEQRHDRHLDLLLGPGLDPEAGRLDARLRDAVRHERRLRRHKDAARERDLHDPRRPAVDRRRLGDADPVRRPAGRDRVDDSGRSAADGHDGPDTRPERARHLLRHAGPADCARHEQRHDRHLDVLLGPRLDHEPGQLDARLRDASRAERRLPRHEGAADDGDVHDPRRPAGRRPRVDDAEPLRRPAGPDRDDRDRGRAGQPDARRRSPDRTRRSRSTAPRTSA